MSGTASRSSTSRARSISITAPRLRELLIDLAGKNSYQLVVNLDKVGFLDSTGLRVLVGGLKRALAHDGSLDLVCTQQRILKILKITGLTEVVGIYETVDQAIAATKGRRKERVAGAGQPRASGLSAGGMVTPSDCDTNGPGRLSKTPTLQGLFRQSLGGVRSVRALAGDHVAIRSNYNTESMPLGSCRNRRNAYARSADHPSTTGRGAPVRATTAVAGAPKRGWRGTIVVNKSSEPRTRTQAARACSSSGWPGTAWHASRASLSSTSAVPAAATVP